MLAYTSWLTMQAKGEADAHTCAYNELALLKLPANASGFSAVNLVPGTEPSIPARLEPC